MNLLAPSIALLVLLAPVLTFAGGRISPPKKRVIISAEQAAGLTNRTERLLHETRIPEVDFRQANIADIVTFLNAASKENAKTEEAKQITIALAPETEKALMKFEKRAGSGGFVGIYTFSGLDMSVLEAVQVLQTVAQLDRKVEGKKMVLSIKKKEQ